MLQVQLAANVRNVSILQHTVLPEFVSRRLSQLPVGLDMSVPGCVTLLHRDCQVEAQAKFTCLGGARNILHSSCVCGGTALHLQDIGMTGTQQPDCNGTLDAMSVSTVRYWAAVYNYIELQHDTDRRLLSFLRSFPAKMGEIVNVFYGTGTVGTCIDHPKKGYTQLSRRKQSIEGLKKILDNPRVHTGEGCYRKEQACEKHCEKHIEIVGAPKTGVLPIASTSTAGDGLYSLLRFAARPLE